ncbi:MAG: SGNH/GDSL hydrolase family protein [Verrucomicrobiota bacterium]
MERVKKRLESDAPLTWVFYGDSITHGARHTFGQRDYTELLAERIRFELDRTMDAIINTAIGGNTTRDLLGGFDWRVARFRPDVVFLMIGMNDCSEDDGVGIEEFESNLLKLTAKTTDLGALPILQTTCPILPGQAADRAPHFNAYMDVIRKVADLQKLPLIDHAKFWQEHAESHFFWMSNAFHPNGHGHKALAEHICRCLDIHDETFPSCRFFIP